MVLDLATEFGIYIKEAVQAGIGPGVESLAFYASHAAIQLNVFVKYIPILQIDFINRKLITNKWSKELDKFTGIMSGVNNLIILTSMKN